MKSKAEKFMQEYKKPILIGGGILLGVIVVWAIFKPKQRTSLPPSVDDQGNITPGSIVTVSWPIKRKAGSLTTKDEQAVIMNIQRYLNAKQLSVYQPLEIDGYFGPKTEASAQTVLGVKEISYKLYNDTILPYLKTRI
jgi:hypothetical protein